MRRCPLIVVSLLALWMVGDHAVLTLNATAQQDNCDLRHRKDNPDLQRAKEAKKAQLRARGYPERFMKLIDREECIACVETASDAFHIMILYKDNAYAPVDSKTGRRWTHHSHAWDPESEIEAREKTQDGTIEGFYIFNTAAKDCICCGDTAAGHRTPQSYSDWDEDLSANKDHLIPFDRSNVGTLPDDLQHPDDKWVGAGPLPVIETFHKPSKKQAHAACPACEASVEALNAAYDALDTLWDQKIANLDAREQLDLELAKTENEIRLLWYQQRSAAMRSDANQQRIEDLETQERRLNDQIRAGVGALDAIEARIEAAQPNIAALEKAAVDCTARCTTPASAPRENAAVNTAPSLPPAPPVTAATPTPVTPPVTPPPPPPASPDPVRPDQQARCPKCAAAAVAAQQAFNAIKPAQDLRDRLADQLEAERRNGAAIADRIKNLNPNVPSASLDFANAQLQQVNAQIKELTSQLATAGIHAADLEAAYTEAMDTLRLCNQTCDTVASQPTDSGSGNGLIGRVGRSLNETVPEPAPPLVPADPVEAWTNCIEKNNCEPVETDPFIPGNFPFAPPVSSPPAVNLFDNGPWTTSINIEIEIRVQDKLADILNPPDYQQFLGPSVNQTSPAPDLYTPPYLVIPSQAPPAARAWLDVLGLLARNLVDHVDRWRASLAPRPLITTRDLETIDRVSNTQAAGLPKGVHVMLMDQGGSTGKTLVMNVLNLSGQPVRLSSKPFAVQPIKQQAQQQVMQAFSKLSKASPVKLNMSAYCVEMLKAPPGPSTLLRLAPQALQQKYAPMTKVLQSAFRVSKANALHPDSNPAAYTDSIKQWSLWTVEQKLNESRFTDAFLALTKKNVEAAGQQWSKQADDAVHKAAPNRWRDIVTILRGAGVAAPQ